MESDYRINVKEFTYIHKRGRDQKQLMSKRSKHVRDIPSLCKFLKYLVILIQRSNFLKVSNTYNFKVFFTLRL